MRRIKHPRPRRASGENPLEGYTDKQLEEMLARATRAHNHGAHILGPESGHCVAIEINRRKCEGLWTIPKEKGA